MCCRLFPLSPRKPCEGGVVGPRGIAVVAAAAQMRKALGAVLRLNW
jgi:hypothetical protein